MPDCRRPAPALALAVVLLAGCQVAAPQDEGARAVAPGAPAAAPPGTTQDGEDGEDLEDGEAEGDDEGGTGDAGRPFTLAFAGDVHFEEGVADVLERPGATLGPMSRALREADLAVLNLESALASDGRRARKELEDPARRYWFRSPPAALDLLERSGVDVVSLANNHGADYGARGLRESLRADATSPVALVGVGRDAEQAYAPHRVRVAGNDVAVLAADASMRESRDATWSAGDGIGLAAAREPDAPALVAAVEEAAARDDVVVVYLHWGEEGARCPSPLQRGLARSLAEAGADVVVGTHAHELQGAGMLGETYVGYGLGNFVWYHGRQRRTGVLQLRVADGEVVSETWLPAAIPREGGRPRALAGPERRLALAEWSRLRACADLVPLPSSAPAPPAGEEGPSEDGAALPPYAATVSRIGPDLRRRMTGVSHDPARCPVPLSDLRHLALSYVGFDGRARTGYLVVRARHARDLVGVFRELYEARWPIRQMRMVDAFGGDDDRSMAADNTSGYNCRTVAGQESWSDHAYGAAVDLNPVENPYDTGEAVLPPAGRRWVAVDRSPGAEAAPGVIVQGDVVTRAFARIGWEWGGTWSDPDYQHFSAP